MIGTTTLRNLCYGILISMLGASCIQKSTEHNVDGKKSSFEIPELEYLKGAEIVVTEKDTTLIFRHPQNNTVYNELKINQDIYFPLERVVTISATHIPYFSALGKLEVIKGMSHPEYSLNEAFQEKVNDGKITDISGAQGEDFEKTLNCEPEAVLIYPFGAKDYSKYDELGIHVLNITEYLEKHPLAKAEWIKVFGVLLNETELAIEIFEKIESEYKSIVQNKPNHGMSAFVGEPFKGLWNQPSGSSYMAHLLNDAGFQYIWRDSLIDKNLEFDFEKVYAEAIDADYWFIAAPRKKGFTLNDLKKEDSRFKKLKSVQNGNVYLCNTSLVDYFGEGGLYPQVILQDFVMAAQNDDKEGTYFKKLRD